MDEAKPQVKKKESKPATKAKAATAPPKRPAAVSSTVSHEKRYSFLACYFLPYTYKTLFVQIPLSIAFEEIGIKQSVAHECRSSETGEDLLCVEKPPRTSPILIFTTLVIYTGTTNKLCQ